MNNFYLYRHIRPDKNEVFYVGIGSKTKQDITYNTFSRANTHQNRNKYWKNIVKSNPTYEIEVILESDNLGFIKEREIEFIKLYGRKDLKLGTLCNISNGGEGAFGRTTSKETKLKISNSNKGKIRKSIKDETREKLRIAAKNRIISNETRIKMSESAKGIKPSEEAKKKMSLAKLKNPTRYWKNKTRPKASEETKRKQSESMIKAKYTGKLCIVCQRNSQSVLCARHKYMLKTKKFYKVYNILET